MNGSNCCALPFSFPLFKPFSTQFSSNWGENCPERKEQKSIFFLKQNPSRHTSSCREFRFQADDVMGFVSQGCNK